MIIISCVYTANQSCGTMMKVYWDLGWQMGRQWWKAHLDLLLLIAFSNRSTRKDVWKCYLLEIEHAILGLNRVDLCILLTSFRQFHPCSGTIWEIYLQECIRGYHNFSLRLDIWIVRLFNTIRLTHYFYSTHCMLNAKHRLLCLIMSVQWFCCPYEGRDHTQTERFSPVIHHHVSWFVASQKEWRMITIWGLVALMIVRNFDSN